MALLSVNMRILDLLLNNPELTSTTSFCGFTDVLFRVIPKIHLILQQSLMSSAAAYILKTFKDEMLLALHC